jgi:hypothetical protein
MPLPSLELLAPSYSSFPCQHITSHVRWSSYFEDGRSKFLRSRGTYQSTGHNIATERSLRGNRHENLISLTRYSAVSQYANWSRIFCLAEADSRGFLSAQQHICLPTVSNVAQQHHSFVTLATF